MHCTTHVLAWVAPCMLGNKWTRTPSVPSHRIADAFNNGMEYFATYGGCTAAGATGLAVLRVLRQERLQERAVETGAYLLDKLRTLQQVRCSGVHVAMCSWWWRLHRVVCVAMSRCSSTHSHACTLCGCLHPPVLPHHASMTSAAPGRAGRRARGWPDGWL